jgi:hypothetical protein
MATNDTGALKARRRAKSDTSTALNRLAEWAEALGKKNMAQELRDARAWILSHAEELDRDQKRRDAREQS